MGGKSYLLKQGIKKLRFLESSSVIKEDVFWTSGTDEGSEGTFGMGVDKPLLPKTAKFDVSQVEKMLSIIINLFRWAANQPDDVSKTQNCLAVEIFGTKYGFKDENCASAQRYICYAKESVGMTTLGKHSQKDCAFNFGIDESNLIYLQLLEHFLTSV